LAKNNLNSKLAIKISKAAAEEDFDTMKKYIIAGLHEEHYHFRSTLFHDVV